MAGVNTGGNDDNDARAECSPRSPFLLAFGLATSALADDKNVKIGVLNDMSSLYADIGGPNSVAAIKMAVEDSGLPAKGWKIEVLERRSPEQA